MGFKYTAVLVVTFCLYSTSSGAIDLNTWINNPAIRDNIVNSILQTQGTSASEIQNVIDSAGGNVNQAVTGINSLIKESLLSVQGGLVKVNPQAVQNIVRNAIGGSIGANLPNNPELAATVQSSVNEQIVASGPQVAAAAEDSAVSVDVAVQSLKVRRKRAAEDTAVVPGLVDIVGNLISSIIGDQIKGLLVGLLGNVKSFVSGLIIVVAPGNPVGDLVAGAVNFVVKGLIQVLTSIEQILTVPQTADTPARRKRDLTDIIADPTPDTNGGLLDVIVRPVLTLLAGILTSVNGVVKSLVNAINGLLTPVLGSLLITRLANIINPIIDLLLPANPI